MPVIGLELTDPNPSPPLLSPRLLPSRLPSPPRPVRSFPSPSLHRVPDPRLSTFFSLVFQILLTTRVAADMGLESLLQAR